MMQFEVEVEIKLDIDVIMHSEFEEVLLHREQEPVTCFHNENNALHSGKGELVPLI